MVTRVMMIAAAMRTVWLFNAAAKLRRMALRLDRVTKDNGKWHFILAAVPRVAPAGLLQRWRTSYGVAAA